jgi:hypothetical protein
MGSFTEVVLSFPFAKEVPDEILAAFSDSHTPLIGRLEGSEPPLPAFDTLDIGDVDAAELVDEIDMADAALFEEASLALKAFVWHAMFEGMDTVYFSGHPNTHLVWEPYGKYWTLTTRFQRKAGPDTVCGFSPLSAPSRRILRMRSTRCSSATSSLNTTTTHCSCGATLSRASFRGPASTPTSRPIG